MAEETPTVDTPTGEQQTTDTAKPADQVATDTTTATVTPIIEGAPESYEAFKLPDGVQMNEGVMGEFSQLAKDANLPQAKAQAFVELGAEMAKGFESAAQQSLADLKQSFADDLAKDPVLGGENVDANLAIAKRALDAFGTPELQTMLNESGLGKHPLLVQLLHKVGQTVAEDTLVDGNAGDTQGGKSMAERMYGKSA